MDEKSFKKLLDEALDPIKQDVHCLKENVDTLKVSVLSIEQTMTSYADSYKENQRNIERLDTRLTTVENNLDIEPPQELIVPHFAE